MDSDRFDRLTRAVANSTSRRAFAKMAIASAVGALFATLGLDDALAAANPDDECRRCRRGGNCTPRNEGRTCGRGSGRCGTCTAGACVSNPAACFDCEVCSAATKTCVPAPNREGTSCGLCGICEEGQCVRSETRDGVACGSCGACDDGRCKKQDDRCDADACERCRRQSDGTFACESKCRTDEECCNGNCVPQGKCCGDEVCRASQVCCPDQQRCVRSLDECCAGCSPCERCNRETGACTADPTKEGQRCPANGPCAGICKDGTCHLVVQNQRCADGNRCCRDGCCSGSITSCCGGVCCNTGECCNGQCCDGFCVLGVCCPIGFTAAEVTDADAVAAGAPLCCPYGPPCGSSCCEQTEQCCGDQCCDAGADCCGDHCCHAGEQCCGDGCCPVDRQCCDDVCCAPNTVCCGDGTCRGQCGQCPAGKKVCETRPEFGSFFCCAEDAPCCPGNSSIYRCSVDPQGLCCDKDSVACLNTCCPLENVCGGAVFPDGTQHFVCCPPDQETCYDFCCPVGTQCTLINDVPACS